MSDIKTPYYLIDEAQLQSNLEKVAYLREMSGTKSVLALKCFSTWSTFRLIREYMDGTTSSSLYEARLGNEKFGKEVHAYSVAFSKEDIDELNGFAAGRNNTGAIVLKTTDGGTTWTNIYQANIPGEYIWKLQILDNNPNAMFGALYASNPNPGKLIKSLDGGANWTTYNAPESAVEAVGFVSETKGNAFNRCDIFSIF